MLSFGYRKKVSPPRGANGLVSPSFYNHAAPTALRALSVINLNRYTAETYRLGRRGDCSHKSQRSELPA